MKSFKQFLNEIFDNPYDYNMFRSSKYFSSAYFFTEDKKLFSVNIAERETNIVEVGFSAHPDYESEMSFDMNLTPPFSENSFREYINRSMGTDEKLDIDTKDVGRIFATVIKITEEYYVKFNPDVVFFRAKNSEENRVRLYNRMAKKFADKYKDENGRSIFDLSINPSANSTSFELRKRNVNEELDLKPGKWEVITTNSAKEEIGDNLVDLVQTAYSTTPKGSFINSVKDIIPSNWFVVDLDADPEAEATVFYRTDRPDEKWVGKKIQGIGHDGQIHNGIKSSKFAIDKIVELINQTGWWIECSDALRHVLLKRRTEFPIVQDVNTLRKIFNDPKLEMVDDITYRRFLTNGDEIVESLLGKPVLKKK